MPLEITEKIKILNKEIYHLKNNIDWDKSNSELNNLIKIRKQKSFIKFYVNLLYSLYFLNFKR